MQSWLDFSKGLAQGLRDFGDTWGLTIAFCGITLVVGIYIYGRIHRTVIRNKYYKEYLERHPPRKKHIDAG